MQGPMEGLSCRLVCLGWGPRQGVQLQPVQAVPLPSCTAWAKAPSRGSCISAEPLPSALLLILGPVYATHSAQEPGLGSVTLPGHPKAVLALCSLTWVLLSAPSPSLREQPAPTAPCLSNVLFLWYS